LMYVHQGIMAQQLHVNI